MAASGELDAILAFFSSEEPLNLDISAVREPDPVLSMVKRRSLSRIDSFILIATIPRPPVPNHLEILRDLSHILHL
jgi:hypothetical protein